MFFPTSLRDAFSGDPGSMEWQGSARYDRRRGHDELLLLPQFQGTPVEGLLLGVGLPYVAGSGPQSNSGQFSLGALYQINHESGPLPALAVAVDAGTPVGPGDRAVEVQLTGVATRTLDRDGQFHLHLNAAWQRRLAPSEDERRDGYRFIVGLSRNLGPDTTLIADVVRDRQEKGRRDANVVELGARHRVTPWMTLGFGAGAGIGRDSPRLRALFSVEFDL